MSTFQLNIRQFIYSLSNALDLVGVTNVFHGRRVAYMSNLCANALGWDKPLLDQLFEASILHDCGVSQTNVHAKLTQLQWEEESNHCLVGADLHDQTKSAQTKRQVSEISEKLNKRKLLNKSSSFYLLFLLVSRLLLLFLL